MKFTPNGSSQGSQSKRPNQNVAETKVSSSHIRDDLRNFRNLASEMTFKKSEFRNRNLKIRIKKQKQRYIVVTSEMT